MFVKTMSAIALLVAISFSVPQQQVAEFSAGEDCTIAVGNAKCASTGGINCPNSYKKCNLGDQLNAKSCTDGTGGPALLCAANLLCGGANHATRDTNCQHKPKPVPNPQPIDPVGT